MLSSWISGHAPDRVFLEGGGGRITFGHLQTATRDGVSGQAVVAPGDDIESVMHLLVPPGRQLVVVDPGLPPPEAERRVVAARAAETRAAATVLFTSGSSGAAKAVRLTGANWRAAVAASAAHLRHGSEDVWLAAMPLHHVGGLSILYRSAFVGGRVVWLPRFDVGEVVSRLRGGVTIASLVPTMLRRVLDYDPDPYPPRLRAVLVGGGPIPDGLVEEAHERGLAALPTYGMTETCAQVATLRPGSPPRRAAHPLPGVELRLAEAGRIEVKGDQVSPGYADEDDRPPGAWFATADRGEIEPDGALRVLGRMDDAIVTGGENVDPSHVEDVLSSHPSVFAVVVAGVDDAEWGQRVVGMYEGEAGPEEVVTWASERLARHEVPRPLRKVEAVPRTGIGKPDRARVRRLLGP